jgi:thiol-disulfide isomerase/thioredoxin
MEVLMIRNNYWPALILALVGMMIMTACAGGSQSAPTAAPTQPTAQAVAQATITITSLPTQPPAVQGSPYPYPQPALAQPTLSGAAYPTPGESQPAVIDSYPTATGPYPPPGLDNRNPATTAQPLSGAQPSATAQPSSGAQPTATLKIGLQATDPATVQLASGKLQLVEFFAFWDGTSKASAPFMNALEVEYGEQINFIYLDIDDPANDLLKKQLGFRLQPHLFFLDEKGNIIQQWEGSIDAAELREAIASELQ